MLIEIRTLDTNTSKSKVRQTQTKPLQHVVEPNSRIEIYIDGQKQTGQPTPGTPGKKLSKVGKDLVISQEDETLLELVNFYDAADVTLVGEYWPITGTQLTSVPEGFAYQAAATQEVAALVPASSSILPWGLGALAAAGLGGGGGGGGGGTDNGGTSALNVISAYNGSNPTPTLTHYSTAGVLNVTGDRLDAINSAIALLSTEATNTSAKVQAVVNGYNAIIAAADGKDNNATNPTLAQYAAIGVTGVDTPQKAQLLGDVIDVKSYSDVDTVAKLQKLADGVAAVMMGAKGNTAPTLAELQALGINNATQDNLLAVQSAIAQTKDDGSDVDTLSELQSLVNAVIDALNVISAYDGSNTTPTLTHYSTAGVLNVPADTLDAINSAIALLSTEATNTSAKVQAVVNGYNAIIAAADGKKGEEGKDNNATYPTMAQYAAIGVTGVDTPQKAQLLGDVIDIKSYLGINTVAEIQALAATANKLMSLTEATKQNISQKELESFGMIDLTPDRFGVLLNKVKDNTANGGVNIDTLKELQDLVDITSPTFTTDASQVFRRDVVEKTSGSFYTVKANDSSGIKSYSLSNDDGRHFKIDPTTGALSFINTPDFENPLDGFTLPDEPRNTYYFTVYATDWAGNTSAQGMNVNVLSLVGIEKVLDLGNDASGKWYGQLIKPVKAEGKWYYHWDRNGNNQVDRGDAVDHMTLDGLVNRDINGNDDLYNADNTNEVFRYTTLNGIKIALPTANGTDSNGFNRPYSTGTALKGTAYDLLDGNSQISESQLYDDILAIWDAYNGNFSDNTFNLPGIPPGWGNQYWTATTIQTSAQLFAVQHAFIRFHTGSVWEQIDAVDSSNEQGIYAAFQVISA